MTSARLDTLDNVADAKTWPLARNEGYLSICVPPKEVGRPSNQNVAGFTARRVFSFGTGIPEIDILAQSDLSGIPLSANRALRAGKFSDLIAADNWRVVEFMFIMRGPDQCPPVTSRFA